MHRIKTNYTENRKLVLSSNEDKIIAIINTPTNADITKKVLFAIEEDLSVPTVYLTSSIEVDEFDDCFMISIVAIEEDGETLDGEYYLTLVEEY
jgi:hypothetical protein